MVHGVGAVADDDALHPLFDLAADRLRRADPLFGSHVFGKDAVEFFGLKVADVGQFGHGAIELARREGGDHRAGTVVEAAGDGAAGAKQLDARFFGIVREGLFGDLVVGLPAPHDLDGGDAGGGDADIVPRAQLEDDVAGIGGLGARQDDAGIAPLAGDDADIAPDRGLEILQRGQRFAAIPLVIG